MAGKYSPAIFYHTLKKYITHSYNQNNVILIETNQQKAVITKWLQFSYNIVTIPIFLLTSISLYDII